MKKLIIWLFNIFKKQKTDHLDNTPPSIIKTDEEYIELFAEKTLEGGNKPKEPIFEIGEAINNYMNGLEPKHRSEVWALINKTCTKAYVETKVIPV